MAEQFSKLISIGIDPRIIANSIQSADELAVKIKALRDAQKESGVVTAESEGKIKALTQVRNQDLQVVKQANILLEDSVQGQQRLKAILSIQTAALNKLTTEEQLSTAEGQRLAKSVKDITDELKANEKAVGNNTRNVGKYEDALGKTNASLDKLGAAAGKMPGPLGAMATGIIGATKAAIAFIATPLGLVLAAVALAIGAVKLAFSSSEEGQNKWNKIVSVGSALLGNFTDIISDFGEKIIEAFENPQRAIKDFAKMIQDNIINRFNGLIELVPALGKSIEQLFKGNFAEAGKIAADAAAKVALGVENITDKTKGAIEAGKEFLAEQKKELAQAAQVADMRAKADIVERDLLTERAMSEAKVAELRLKARKEDEFTAAQRKGFLLEANKIQTNLLDSETQYLKLRADAQTLENTFSKTNKENKTLEAQAIAALSQVETKRFTEQRQLQRELNTISKQLAADGKARAEIKRKLTEDEIKQEGERIVAITKGFEDQRALIDEMAETEKNLATINISNAEERAKKIAFIDRETLHKKISSIDDETATYTASADMVGSVDKEKYAKQLAQRAQFEAQLADANRAARSQEFNDKIEALALDERLEMEAAELSIDNEKDLAAKKGEIALRYLSDKLALMTELANADKILTEEEIKNLQLVENAIKKIKGELANPDAPTLGQSLGIDEEAQADIKLGLEVVSGLIASVQSALAAGAENRLQDVDNQTNAEIAAVQKSTLSEEQKAAKIKAIEKKAAMTRYKIELEQFKVSKALSIAMAVANTATAVMAQLSNPTPYAGFVLAALAGVLGGIQIGIASSTKPPAPPQFAKGGFVSGAGTSTSDSIPTLLSDGESVNNAVTTAMFGRELSAMNAAGGGVDWYRGNGYAQGGLVQKFAAGGIAISSGSMVQSAEANAIMSDAMMSMQPVLVIEDFQSVQGRQIRTVENLEI